MKLTIEGRVTWDLTMVNPHMHDRTFFLYLMMKSSVKDVPAASGFINGSSPQKEISCR